MASKKKDGGAERAKARKAVRNKRQEAKYGLQGFVKQANKNLKAPGKYIPTAWQSGMGIIEASGVGVGKAVAKTAAKVGAKNLPALVADTAKVKQISVSTRRKVAEYLWESGRFDDGFGVSVLRDIKAGKSGLPKIKQIKAKTSIKKGIKSEIKATATQNAARKVVEKRAEKIIKNAGKTSRKIR